MSEAKLYKESHYLDVNPVAKLHIRRFYCAHPQTPVFMLHGAIENGRIFYSDSDKGLAPFLARQGYDVYVLDLRGRGGSSPAIDRYADYGQYEAITEDIPLALDLIVSLRGRIPQYWIAHSWGGVLLSSYYARSERHRDLVKRMVYFGCKRAIRSKNWRRLFIIEILWKRIVPLLIAHYGYLPTKELHIGSDNEPRNSYFEGREWVAPKPWIDPRDGFDYGAAIQALKLPPILYFAAIKDYYLGNPRDVADFMKESGEAHADYRLLAKRNGQLHDYDHITMLTHPDAVKDHFINMLRWLNP